MGVEHSHPTPWLYIKIGILLTVITGATMPLAQPGPLILLSAVLGFAVLGLDYPTIPAVVGAVASRWVGVGSCAAMTTSGVRQPAR